MIIGSHKCIQFLSRAAHTGADCTRFPYCGRLKNIVKHFKICQEGVKNNCRICLTFMDLIKIHKKKCRLANQETCCLTYCKHLSAKVHTEQEHLKVRNTWLKSLRQKPGSSTAMDPTQSSAAQTTLDIVKQIQSKLRKEREKAKCIADMLDNYKRNLIIPSVRSQVDAMVELEDPGSLDSLQSLEHSSRCTFGTCSASCRRMKNVILHCVSCLPETVGPPACLVCSTFIQLCLVHARKCQDSDCPIYLCLNIRRVASSLLGEDDLGLQYSPPEINQVKGWLSNPCRYSNTENNGPRNNFLRSGEERMEEFFRRVGTNIVDRLFSSRPGNRWEGGLGRRLSEETEVDRLELEAVDPADILAPSSTIRHPYRSRPHPYYNSIIHNGREAGRGDVGEPEREATPRSEPPDDSTIWDERVEPYYQRLITPDLTSLQYESYLTILKRSIREQQLRLIQRLKDLERRVCGVRRDAGGASLPASMTYGFTD